MYYFIQEFTAFQFCIFLVISYKNSNSSDKNAKKRTSVRKCAIPVEGTYFNNHNNFMWYHFHFTDEEIKIQQVK